MKIFHSSEEKGLIAGSVVLVSACSYICEKHQGPFSSPENSYPDLVVFIPLTSCGLQKRCTASTLPPGNHPQAVLTPELGWELLGSEIVDPGHLCTKDQGSTTTSKR